MEKVEPVKPSNAATKVEEASVRVNSRFVIPPKPTTTFNKSNPPPKPQISSSTPVIMAPNTKRSTVFNVSKLFTSGNLSKLASKEEDQSQKLLPKSGGKRTKKRSKKAKKTRKH